MQRALPTGETVKHSKSCPHCNGTGRVLDQGALGQELRLLREASKLTGREMARRLGISAPYLSDLELGRRQWHTDMIIRFKKKCRDV